MQIVETIKILFEIAIDNYDKMLNLSALIIRNCSFLPKIIRFSPKLFASAPNYSFLPMHTIFYDGAVSPWTLIHLGPQPCIGYLNFGLFSMFSKGVPFRPTILFLYEPILGITLFKNYMLRPRIKRGRECMTRPWLAVLNTLPTLSCVLFKLKLIVKA